MSTLAFDDLGATRWTSRALDEASDAVLLERVRGDDEDAYAVLYRRHEAAAHRLARQLERSSAGADDLVSETFTSVLVALRNGSGPTEAFRPYLLTALRRRHWRRSASPEDPADPTDATFEQGSLDDDTDDGQLMATAFRTLPERWQLVLWHTEIEGAPPAEVAPLVGLSPHATAALAHRAREGLREAYLQAHLQSPGHDGCQATVTRMGAHVRGNLGQRDQARTDAHLAECSRCQGMRQELSDINRSLRSVVAPLVLGSAAAAYLGRRAVTASPATSAVAHTLRGSARRIAIVGTTLALTVGLLVARSDLTHSSPDTSAAGASATAASAVDPTGTNPTTAGQPSVRTIALPDGPTLSSDPGALGAACAAGTVGAGALAPAGDAEGGIVSAVLFRGTLGGLAPAGSSASVTPIHGSALTTLQSLAGQRQGSAEPAGDSGANAGSTQPAATCVSVAAATLLTGTGSWHVLVGYLPADDAPALDGLLQFAVLEKPFALLGDVTRTVLDVARTVLATVVTALPGIVAALTGQVDPLDITDLTAATTSVTSTVGDVLGALGSGTGSIVDDAGGATSLLDDVTGTGGTGGTPTGTGGGTTGTGGLGTGGTPVDPTPPTGGGVIPPIPPVSIPGPVDLPPVTLPPLPLPPLNPPQLPLPLPLHLPLL